MKYELTLTEAAAAMDKCPRQIRRYISSGRLPASGGGHGVPFMVKRSDLLAFIQGESLRDRVEWVPVMSGARLAQLAFSLHQKRMDHSCRWLPWFESTMLWKWGQSGKSLPVDLFFRNCVAPVESVPADVMAWASGLESRLTALELDYIGAMVIATAHPWKRHTVYERDVYGKALDITCQKPESEKQFVLAFESGDIELLLRLIYGETTSTGKWIAPIYPELADRDNLGHEKGIAKTLIESAKKAGVRSRLLMRGLPSGAMVTSLLCLKYRIQGTRVVDGLKRKLGRDGVNALFVHLGCAAPRAWRMAFTRVAESRKVEPQTVALTAAVLDEAASILGLSADLVPRDSGELAALLRDHLSGRQVGRDKVTVNLPSVSCTG